jgi:hypothetical protein
LYGRVVRSRAATWVVLVFSTIVILGVFVQAYTITAYVTDGDETALDIHGVMGFLVIHGSELIVFIASLFAFWRAWRWIGWCFVLIALGTVQIVLAPPEDDRMSGWVHGLHGLLALVVLVIAALIAHHAMRLLRQRALPAATAP